MNSATKHDRSSLRRHFRGVLVASAFAAVLATALGIAALMALLDARSRMVDRIDPARWELEALQTALVDQETALRGYLLTGDGAYLDPYRSGAQDQARTAAALHDLAQQIDGDGEPFAAVQEAAERWRDEYAEPTLTAHEADPDAPADLALLSFGRTRFDAFRTAADGLRGQLDAARADAGRGLRAATVRLTVTLLIAEALLLSAIGALWWRLRRSVLVPLTRLGADADVVSGGALTHHIEAVGPPELQALATTMESMRSRLVAELDAATEARAQLELQHTELARSNAELEQFAYVASHDLQEPLRKVASFCQLLQSRYGGQLDARADQYIDFAVDGAKRMQALINDLLAFSRVGRLTRPFEEVPLDAVLGAALTNLATTIEEHGAVVLAEPLPTVLGDPALLVAVLQNLIGNAVKFAQPDIAPEVTISTRSDGADHVVTVRDNGIGIEAEYAERVFVIFQRLHTKEDYAGTGIGLALCRKIIEFHGGRIWVDTLAQSHAAAEAPNGTTIHFTLPVVVEAAASAHAKELPR